MDTRRGLIMGALLAVGVALAGLLRDLGFTFVQPSAESPEGQAAQFR